MFKAMRMLAAQLAGGDLTSLGHLMLVTRFELPWCHSSLAPAPAFPRCTLLRLSVRACNERDGYVRDLPGIDNQQTCSLQNLCLPIDSGWFEILIAVQPCPVNEDMQSA